MLTGGPAGGSASRRASLRRCSGRAGCTRSGRPASTRRPGAGPWGGAVRRRTRRRRRRQKAEAAVKDEEDEEDEEDEAEDQPGRCAAAAPAAPAQSTRRPRRSPARLQPPCNHDAIDASARGRCWEPLGTTTAQRPACACVCVCAPPIERGLTLCPSCRVCVCVYGRVRREDPRS